MEFKRVVLVLVTFIVVTIGQQVYESTNIDEDLTNSKNEQNAVQHASKASDSIFFNDSIASNKITQISMKKQRSLPDMANNIFECNQMDLTTEEPLFITSPGFPFFYMFGQNIQCHLRGTTGRGIEVIVYEVSLESVSHDYLLIKPGDQSAPADRGIIFTSQLDSVFKYWFHDADDLFIQFVSPQRMTINNQFRGFNMSVQYIDEYVPWPVEVEVNETAIALEPRDNHTVFLDGRTPLDFVNVSQQFVEILVDMATNFTLERGLTQGEFLMNETVQLRLITHCRLSWPHTHLCTAVTFSIPTYFNETTGHYELNATLLEDMWETYGRSTVVVEALAELQLWEYILPDDIRALTLWLVCSGAVVVAMIIVAIVIAQFNYFGNYKSVEAYTETDSEPRKSSLYPAPHQDMPAMFHEDNQDVWGSDLAYEDYDYNRESYTNNGFVKDGELFDLDSDEEIVMSLPDGPPKKSQVKREMDA